MFLRGGRGLRLATASAACMGPVAGGWATTRTDSRSPSPWARPGAVAAAGPGSGRQLQVEAPRAEANSEGASFPLAAGGPLRPGACWPGDSDRDSEAALANATNRGLARRPGLGRRKLKLSPMKRTQIAAYSDTTQREEPD
jgi:hypothetical protein